MQEDRDSTKKAIVDALEGVPDEEIEGRPASPVLPLVGSMNVPITRKEEQEFER